MILPVGGSDRLPQFQAVLSAFRCQVSARSEILVVEQGAEPLYRGRADGARYHFLEVDPDEGFNKSRLMNRGVERASAEHVLLHDADVVPPADYLAGVLRRLDAGWEAVRPLRLVFHLDQGASSAFIGSDGGELPEHVDTVVQNNPGLSTAVRRDVYHELGGHDERFEGWGGEDTEFLQRLETRRLFLGGYTYGIHLWHPPAPKYASGDRNRELFDDITREPPEARIERLQAMPEG